MIRQIVYRRIAHHFAEIDAADPRFQSVDREIRNGKDHAGFDLSVLRMFGIVGGIPDASVLLVSQQLADRRFRGNAPHLADLFRRERLHHSGHATVLRMQFVVLTGIIPDAGVFFVPHRVADIDFLDRVRHVGRDLHLVDRQSGKRLHNARDRVPVVEPADDDVGMIRQIVYRRIPQNFADVNAADPRFQSVDREIRNGEHHAGFDRGAVFGPADDRGSRVGRIQIHGIIAEQLTDRHRGRDGVHFTDLLMGDRLHHSGHATVLRMQFVVLTGIIPDAFVFFVSHRVADVDQFDLLRHGVVVAQLVDRKIRERSENARRRRQTETFLVLRIAVEIVVPDLSFIPLRLKQHVPGKGTDVHAVDLVRDTVDRAIRKRRDRVGRPDVTGIAGTDISSVPNGRQHLLLFADDRRAVLVVERHLNEFQVQQFVERHPLRQFVGGDLAVDQVAEEVVGEFLFDADGRVREVARNRVLGLVPLIVGRIRRIGFRERIGPVMVSHRLAEIDFVEGVGNLVAVVVDQTVEVDVRRRAVETADLFVVLIEPARDLLGIERIVLDRGVFQKVPDVEPLEHVADLEVAARQVGDLLLGERLRHAVEVAAVLGFPARDLLGVERIVPDRGIFQKVADVEPLERVVDLKVAVHQFLDRLLCERLGHAIEVLAALGLPTDDVALAVLDGGIAHQVADVEPGNQVVDREAVVEHGREFFVGERPLQAVGRVAVALEPAGDIALGVEHGIELLEEAEVGIDEQIVDVELAAQSADRSVGDGAHRALDAGAVGVEPVDDDPAVGVVVEIHGRIAEQIARFLAVDDHAEIERKRPGVGIFDDHVADRFTREQSVHGLVVAARHALDEQIDQHVVHAVVDDREQVAAVADDVKRLAEIERRHQFEQGGVRRVLVDRDIPSAAVLFVLNAGEIPEFHSREQVGHFQVDDLFQRLAGQRLARRLRQNVGGQELEEIRNVGMFEDRRDPARREDLLHRERTDARRDLLHDPVGDLQPPTVDQQIDRDRLVEVLQFLDLGDKRLDRHGSQVDVGFLVDVLPLVHRDDAPLLQFVKRHLRVGVVPHPDDRPDTGQKAEEEGKKQGEKTCDGHIVPLSDRSGRAARVHARTRAGIVR